MPRKIEPYWQGELDSLCGIHAIINACYSLFPDMKDREADRLFYKLLEEVGRKRSNPLRIAWRGIDGSLFRHLLLLAVNTTARKRAARIEISRPFAKSSPTLPALVRILRTHADEGGVATVLVRGKSSHWTVVNRVTQTKMKLFDSVGLERLRINQCALKPGKRYRIHAHEIMLLRKNVGQGDGSAAS